MKLRDKNTGESLRLKIMAVEDDCPEGKEITTLDGNPLTLANLCEKYDDAPEYFSKVQEDAIRAWAKANGLSGETQVAFWGYGATFRLEENSEVDCAIDLVGEDPEGLTQGNEYTLKELGVM